LFPLNGGSTIYFTDTGHNQGMLLEQVLVSIKISFVLLTWRRVLFLTSLFKT